jgi:hypothetical protein
MYKYVWFYNYPCLNDWIGKVWNYFGNWTESTLIINSLSSISYSKVGKPKECDWLFIGVFNEILISGLLSSIFVSISCC